ncbi:MAG: ferrous iron transport protein B [Saprospiraceae bacterium]
MTRSKDVIVALVGNPNSGKSSVFNLLTGLRQKVGNFPGVTVDKKLGKALISPEYGTTIIDFPGIYSLFPNSQDEKIVVSTFLNEKDENYPDLVVYVADVTNLERHLLLLTQIRDLGLPLILALNMKDLAEKEGIVYQPELLADLLKVPVVPVSSRSGENFDVLTQTIKGKIQNLHNVSQETPFYKLSPQEKNAAQNIAGALETQNFYRAKLIGHHHGWLPFLSEEEKTSVASICKEAGFEDLQFQIKETMNRYDNFVPIVRKVLQKTIRKNASWTDRLDHIVMNRFWGPVIFIAIMILVFQAIYSWSGYPMDWIESLFMWLGENVKSTLPDNWFTGLLTDGIIAGLGGILVFVPQIAILFFLIALLEEVGYMARAVFIFDNLMQKFGLNGRSIVALISGGACAIPAIMSTRTISNWKERLITILVTPFISCSARIPVYTVLIGFVVPSITVWGIFNLQGLAFMGLYLLGIIAALGTALIFKYLLKSEETSFLTIELPDYRMPVFKNIFLSVYEKVKTFALEAGKIILVISIILWFLASFGPEKAMTNAELEAAELSQSQNLNEDEAANLLAAKKIEASYAGHIGKAIEPVIEPLGYDWKIGIALLTSFAAREVFIGTMATIYSIGSESDELKIRDKMAQERNPLTGEKVYSLASALSLLIFYVFAMQCMSTLAVVKRETNSWKWPIIQFIFMSGLAYIGGLIAFQLFK